MKSDTIFSSDLKVGRLIRTLTAMGLIFICRLHATVLTFEIRGLADNQAVPQAYGDNVTGTSDAVGSYQEGGVFFPSITFTPNITLEYRTVNPSTGISTSPDLLWRSVGFGDLSAVAFPAMDGNLAEVSLVPDPGYQVTLWYFDLAGYPQRNVDNQTVRVLVEGNQPVYDWTFGIRGTTPAGPSHQVVAPLGVTSFGPLRIQFGPSIDVGIDNIIFSQTPIPEPNQLLLLLLGAVVLGLRFRTLPSRTAR